MEKHKFLISGGGTGGHIFPAISIANALRKIEPDCEILFIGAKGRMEMERVPAAGYRILALPVEGFNRKKLWKNIPVIWNFLRSMFMMRRILNDFKPDVCVGVGGYASGAALKVASMRHIPIVLQEQNGFAGMTNKMLASKASKICVAYEHMEKHFPKDKICITGNPVRQTLTKGSKSEGLKEYGFTSEKPVILIVGGSLGAGTLNKSVLNYLKEIKEAPVQVLWQAGKSYIQNAEKAAHDFLGPDFIVTDFIAHMDLAYAMADIVISRAGASSISEMCLLGKATILVPSPNVTEDHQTHNALALVEKDAAIMIHDKEAAETLIPKALQLVQDRSKIEELQKNILTLAKHDSAQVIAQEVIKLCP